MDTTDTAVNAEKEIVQKQALNVGMVLREARERAGLSVNDVADRIKFAPRQVEALEANDFAHLPQATFLRGFVRSYARVLQLDEAVLIAALPVEPSAQPPVKSHGIDVPFPTVQALRRVNLVWLAAALSVALLLALFVWWSAGAPKVKPEVTAIETITLPTAGIEAASAPQVNSPPVEPVAVPSIAPNVETKPVIEHRKNAEQKNKLPEAKLPVVVDGTTPVPTKPTLPLEVLKRRPLHFVFVDDAWAEVKDVNGAVLLSRVNLRGSEQWIGGPRRAPYEVSISRPANVKLYFKGREIDLSEYAAMEVAHLTVE